MSPSASGPMQIRLMAVHQTMIGLVTKTRFPFKWPRPGGRSARRPCQRGPGAASRSAASTPEGASKGARRLERRSRSRRRPSRSGERKQRGSHKHNELTSSCNITPACKNTVSRAALISSLYYQNSSYLPDSSDYVTPMLVLPQSYGPPAPLPVPPSGTVCSLGEL